MTLLTANPHPPTTDRLGAVHGASYRDPAGFVFTRDGVLYRQVNPAGRDDFDLLVSSGLYAKLAGAGDMVAHEDVSAEFSPDGRAYRVIKPARVQFVSYPYEWSFSELKDAALLTLRLQRTALDHGMSLKDATPYNVLFEDGRPVLIDTLSFERLKPGTPWVAYRQFCQLFLAPLALMSGVDIRLGRLLRSELDGVPLDLASTLLPLRSRLKPGLLIHLHLHAATERRVSRRPPSGAAAASKRQLGGNAVRGLIDSLERTVRSLEWTPAGTVWADYYEATNYTDAAFEHKRQIVATTIERLAPGTVWDLGANDGTFSRLASQRGIPTIAFDVDPAAVEKNYRRVARGQEKHLLPLLMDLTNPSTACGWAHRERESLVERGPADLALALALVHHLAIGHNVPLARVAEYFAAIARALVIEFVPKRDSQVQRMLATREDVFTDYRQEAFEEAFSAHFAIEEAIPVRDSERTVYVMRRLAT
jgi:hypothetical protein